MGWSTYFAFIFATINTLTVTYYLAIENVEFLKQVFPSFAVYVLIITAVGIPILVLVGWIHYRRTAAYGSEAEVQVESNPYFYKARPGWQREVEFPLFLKLTDFMIKSSRGYKFSEEELKEMDELKEKLDKLIKGGYVGKLRSFSEENHTKKRSGYDERV